MRTKRRQGRVKFQTGKVERGKPKAASKKEAKPGTVRVVAYTPDQK